MVVSDSTSSSNNCKYCKKYFTTAKSVKLHEDIFCASKETSDPLALENEDPLAIDNSTPASKALISGKIFERNLRSLKRGLEIVSSSDHESENNNYKKQKLPQGSVMPKGKVLSSYQGITVSKAKNVSPVPVKPLKTTIYSKSKGNNNKRVEEKVVNDEPFEISSDEDEEEEWFDEKFEKNNKRDTTFCCDFFFKAPELEKHKREVHNKNVSIKRIPNKASVDKLSKEVPLNRIPKEISVSKSSNQTSINKISKEMSINKATGQTKINAVDRIPKQLSVNKVSINKMPPTNQTIQKILSKNLSINKVKNVNVESKDENDDDDDDLILTKMEICTVDPLTKKQIVNPVKNRICSHIYEKSTIFPSIDQAMRKRKNMRCPYMGCNNKNVKKADLVYDQDVSTHIKKILQNSNQNDSNIKSANIKKSTVVDKNNSKNHGKDKATGDKTWTFNSAISFVKTKSNDPPKKSEVKSNFLKSVGKSVDPPKKLEIKSNIPQKRDDKSESSTYNHPKRDNKSEINSDEVSKSDEKMEFKCNLCNTEYEKATLLMMHKKWMHDVHFQNVPAATNKTFNESSLPNVSISRTRRITTK